MTTIPDEVKAIDLCRQIDAVPTRWSISCIAEALMQERERATAIERDRCAKFADAWDNPSALRLAAGEMTAQEMRTARAVARGIAATIRSQTL